MSWDAAADRPRFDRALGLAPSDYGCYRGGRSGPGRARARSRAALYGGAVGRPRHGLQHHDTDDSETTRALSADSASSIDDSGSARDLAWRVGNLPLTTHVVTAAASQPLGRAVGLMVENEYSDYRSRNNTAAWLALLPGKALHTPSFVAPPK